MLQFAMTTTSASMASVAVSTPTTVPPATASRSTSAPSRTSAPSARAGGEGVDDGRRVDLGVVAAEACPEYVGADRSGELADFGAVDQLHVEAVDPAVLDELLEDPSLLGRVEVDHPALGAELERHGEVLGQLVVEPPPRQRRLEGPARVAAVQPDEARVAAGRPEPDALLLQQRDRQTGASGEVRGRRPDQPAADDDDATRHGWAAVANVCIASWSVRRASTSAACALSWTWCCW